MLPASAHTVAWHLTVAYRLSLLVTVRWCTRGAREIRLARRAVGLLRIRMLCWCTVITARQRLALGGQAEHCESRGGSDRMGYGFIRESTGTGRSRKGTHLAGRRPASDRGVPLPTAVNGTLTGQPDLRAVAPSTCQRVA